MEPSAPSPQQAAARSATDSPISGLRSFLGGTAVYGVVGFSQRALTFLLLPLYTRTIGPDEYGQLALVWTLTGALTILLSFGLETAIFRTYFRLAGDPRERDSFISTLAVFLFVVPTLLTVAVMLTVLPFIDNWNALPTEFALIGLLATSTYVSATVLPLALLRAEERLGDYLKITAFHLITYTGLTVILVVGFDAGVRGWLISYLVTSILLFPIGIAVSRRYWTTRLSPRHLLAALAFGLPLVPHLFAHWGLSLSDRAILSAWVDASELGVYNLGYQIGASASLFIVAMNRSILPAYGRALTNQAARLSLTRLVTYQVLLVAFAGLATALLGPPAVRFVMPETYSRAADVIPWIALGSVFYGLYVIPMNTVSMIAGETRWVWLATLLAATVNVTLNLLFVPVWGIMAAAINTVIGYAVLFLIIGTYAQWRHGGVLAYEWRRIGVGLGLAGAIYVAAVMTTPGSGELGGLSALGRACWLLLMPVLLLAGEFRSGLQWNSVRNVLRSAEGS